MTDKKTNYFKELQGNVVMVDVNDHPFEIGKKYFVQTVTQYRLGEVEDIKGKFIIWKAKSVWVADTGRFTNAMKHGFASLELAEIEIYEQRGGTHIDSIVNYMDWNLDIPTEQK